MAEGGFGGSYNGGAGRSSSAEDYSLGMNVEEPMSKPADGKDQQVLQSRYEKGKEAVEKPYQRERMAVSSSVSGPLVIGDVLTSRDTSGVIFANRREAFSESPEQKWEQLYEIYISRVLADTLNQNKDFPNKLIMIAAGELPGHSQFREMYKKAFELRNKKDDASKEELKLAVGEIKEILKFYSIVFNENTLSESLGAQSRGSVVDKTREILAARDPDALRKLDEDVMTAPTEEGKMMIFARAVARAEIEQKEGKEAAKMFDKKMDAATPEQQKLILTKMAQESKNPELSEILEEVTILKEVEEKKRLEEEAKKKAEEDKLKEKPKESFAVKSVDTKVTSSQAYAYDQARSAISGSGSTYELSADGTLSFPRGFSVKVEVDKAGQYTLIDSKYADGGKVGPFPLKEFAVKAYERFIDGYISKNIRGRLQNPDEISGIPDNQLVTVGKALLGRGEKNGYKVMGDDLMVLDELIESLLVKDEKYPTLNKKVFALYERVYKNMDDKTLALSSEASTIRRKLLTAGATNKKFSVSELLGENKAEG